MTHRTPLEESVFARIGRLLGIDVNSEADKTGWHRVFWMYGTACEPAAKGGTRHSAAELFARRPKAVIAYARRSAVVDVNAIW